MLFMCRVIVLFNFRDCEILIDEVKFFEVNYKISFKIVNNCLYIGF